MPSMKTLLRIFRIAMVALASKNNVAASIPPHNIREAVAATDQKRDAGLRFKLENESIDSGNQPQSLEEAMLASESKRLDVGLQPRVESPKPSQLRVNTLATSLDFESYPQTLQEAMSASESKRLDVITGAGGLAVEIVDRGQERNGRPFQANQQEPSGSRESLSFLMSSEESDIGQSILVEISTSSREEEEDVSSTVKEDRQQIGFDADFEQFEHIYGRGRRDYQIGPSNSGSVLERNVSMTTSFLMASIGLFVLQVL